MEEASLPRTVQNHSHCSGKPQTFPSQQLPHMEELRSKLDSYFQRIWLQTDLDNHLIYQLLGLQKLIIIKVNIKFT